MTRWLRVLDEWNHRRGFDNQYSRLVCDLLDWRLGLGWTTLRGERAKTAEARRSKR